MRSTFRPPLPPLAGMVGVSSSLCWIVCVNIKSGYVEIASCFWFVFWEIIIKPVKIIGKLGEQDGDTNLATMLLILHRLNC